MIIFAKNYKIENDLFVDKTSFMTTNKELSQFGLNSKESATYLAILELGEANIGQIVKKSRVSRTTLYDVLDSLKQQALISSSRRGTKTFYYAENPRVIGEKLDEKKRTLERMLPELLAIANAIDKKPKIRYYEGLEGIKDVYRDTLKFPEQELLAWVAEEAVGAFDEEFLNKYYLAKRIEKKIWVRAIAPNLPYMLRYQGLDRASLRTTKLIDPKKFPIDVEINLYGKSRIGIMSFTEELGLIIESEKIFRTLKSIFESQWEMLGEEKVARDFVPG